MCGKYGVNMNDEKEKYTADDYRETSFLVIDDEDSSKVIHDFCDAVFAQQLPSENDKNEDVKEQHDAEELILSGKEFLAHFIIDLPKHRLTRAHREKQLKMSCQALHNAPPNRT